MTTCTFVVKPSGNSGADRAVDQAAGQRFQLGGLVSRLKKLPGILPAAKVFSIVDSEREEVLAGLGGLGATTVASTTVPSILTSYGSTAGWLGARAPPVSMVTACWPH